MVFLLSTEPCCFFNRKIVHTEMFLFIDERLTKRGNTARVQFTPNHEIFVSNCNLVKTENRISYFSFKIMRGIFGNTKH